MGVACCSMAAVEAATVVVVKSSSRCRLGRVTVVVSGGGDGFLRPLVMVEIVRV